MRDELLLLGRLAGPTIVMQAVHMLKWVYSASYIGQHYGAEALAGYSLASLSGNLTVVSLIFGSLAAVDTLAPQAHGAKAFAEVGRVCVRAAALCAVILVCLLPVWASMEQILLALHEPAGPSALAGQFLAVWAMALPPISVGAVLVRFYMAHSVVLPSALATALGSLSHPCFVWLFADRMGMGFRGVAMAHVASSTAWCACMCLVCLCGPRGLHHPEAPPTASLAYLRDVFGSATALREHARLALAGVLGMADWYTWELMALWAGQYGVAALAAHTVAYSFVPLVSMVSEGAAVGLQTRVSALLAEDRVDMARRVAVAGATAGLAATAACALAVFALQAPIMAMYTDDAEVVAECRRVWVWVVVMLVTDGANQVAAGVVRALALVWSLGWSVAIALWGFGVPLVYVLAETCGLGLLGIWIGLAAMYGLLAALLLLASQSVDWQEYADSIGAKFEAASRERGAKHTKANDSGDDDYAEAGNFDGRHQEGVQLVVLDDEDR